MLFRRGPVLPNVTTPLCPEKGIARGAQRSPGKQDPGLWRDLGRKGLSLIRGVISHVPSHPIRVRDDVCLASLQASQSSGLLPKGEGGRQFFWKTLLNTPYNNANYVYALTSGGRGTAGYEIVYTA